MPGPGYAVPYGHTGQRKRIAGAPFTVTRPNNVTAYAAGGGQAFGSGADARISIAAPADPGDSLLAGFDQLGFNTINLRSPADAPFALAVMAFSAQPATVLIDQAAFSLSDADIALIFFNQNQAASGALTYQQALAPNGLNQGAGNAGRRYAQTTMIFNLAGSSAIPWGSTIWIYLLTTGAAGYVPLALEQVVVTPVFLYASQV